MYAIMIIALVQLCCYNRIPDTGQFIKETKIWSLTVVMKTEKSKMKLLATCVGLVIVSPWSGRQRAGEDECVSSHVRRVKESKSTPASPLIAALIYS